MINRIDNTRLASQGIHPLAAAIRLCFRRTVSSAIPATGLAMVLAGSGIASAATFQVTHTRDTGAGSLRQAVLDANSTAGTDEIVFDAAVSGTLDLSSGPLEVLESLHVRGPGSEQLAIGAGRRSEIFVISDTTSTNRTELKLSGLTLTNATTAISAQVSDIHPVVTVLDSSISGNLESGITLSSSNSKGTLTVRRSELSGNGSHGVHCAAGYIVSTPSEIHATIEDTIISNNGETGVYADGNVTVDIARSEITGNTYGLASNGYWDSFESRFEVSDSVIADNSWAGISIGDSGILTLKSSSVTENGGTGVYAYADSVSLAIHASTISGNEDDGVYIAHYDYYAHVGKSYFSKLVITDSTISGNGDGSGEGVHVSAESSSVAIRNSTITGHPENGVSVWTWHGTTGVEVENSVIADNGEADLEGDATFTVRHSLIQNTVEAYIDDATPDANIFSRDPLLGPLQNNGGSTQTHALMAGSPAIDGGNNSSCSGKDQRNVVRPQDGNGDSLAICDMGAFELAGDLPPNPTTDSGVIGDLVWQDNNGNGVQDASEPGLAGVTVKLRVGCDNINVISTTTNSKGQYRFENLPKRRYQVEFEKPAGYSFSPRIAAGDYRKDSNVDPRTGLDQCRPLKEGQQRLALDAGFVPDDANNSIGHGGRASMGSYVWQDNNGDGVQDPVEQGLKGVTVKLRVNCDPANVLSTITDSDGAYRFDGLISGSYQLEFVKPDGYSFSPLIAAGDYRIDSNADPQSGLDQCRTLHDAQQRLVLDAGLTPD